MARLRAIYEDGKLVEWVDVREAQIAARKRSACVIEDTVEPFVSHATAEGLVFDSMSKYKEHLDQHGYEITGGSHLTGKTVQSHRHKADREAINATVQEAVRRVKWGMEPFSEKEKHQCLMEQRNYLRAIGK